MPFQILLWNKQATLANLLEERKKRTKLIAKLKDVIQNQDEFTTTDEGYGTDIRFLDVDQNPATKCYYCFTQEDSQIACFCKDSNIYICDNCVIEHRMKNKNHEYIYLSELLRDYKPPNSWRHFFRVFDIKYVNADIVAILQHDNLCTYNLTGRLITSISTITVQDMNSRIACINDCKVAITLPTDNLIKIVSIIAPTTMTDLSTPKGTNMTGGITCRMDILYVAFSDAIRLVDLSGQIQRVVNIPSVKLLHSVNNDKMLCVHSKKDSEKTMSCFDFTNDSFNDFELFPFHPDDVSTDEVGNIIFLEDGVIWQADSDGNNIRIIMSPKCDKAYKKITYNKDSKCLFTYDNVDNVVRLCRKIE